MMGKTHVRMGLAAGMGTAAVAADWIGLMRVSDVALWCALAGGAGLLPDIDHPRSTITRSLGPITWLLHWIVVWCDRAVYASTRTRADPPTMTWERRRWLRLRLPAWSSSHRRSTHTHIGALVAGVAVAVACLLHPLVAVAVVTWIVAVLGSRHVLALPVLGLWVLVALAGGATVASMAETVSGLGAMWGVAVAVGCVSHCWGDGCTKDGAPLWSPFPRHGRRWEKVTAPLTISTDGLAERTVVTWALLALILYLGWVLAVQWLPVLSG